MNFFSSNIKYLTILMIGLTLLFSACNAGEKQASQTSNASVGSTSTAGETAANGQKLKDAPDFTLNNMNGEAFTLSDYEGQVVVLNIWATWCPPCRKEIPDFIEIQKEMRDDGVLFVGVSIDKEGWEVVKPFAKKYGINYPLVVDDGTISQKYGPFRGIPTTFIINKKGKVEYVAPGLVNRQTLKPALEKLANR